MKRVSRLLLALALFNGGCADDKAELERASLGIHAADSTGREADIACEQLPLLQGSRSYATHVIDDRVVIEVIAEPGEVTLRFEDDAGITLAKSVTLPRGLLLNGGDPQKVMLSIDERQYFVTLSMGCEP
jgi:hypothetical protein